MSESTYRTLEIRKEGAVDWLTLNRPDSLNAINVEMVRELRDYFDGLAENVKTRIVVMRGAGRSFCAGLDIKSILDEIYVKDEVNDE